MAWRSLAVMALLVSFPALAQLPQSTPATLDGGSAVAAPIAEKRIGELKAKLMITSAQEPQWAAFATVMRQNAVHMSQLGAGRVSQAGTQKAPDEMRGYTEVARAHAEDLNRLIAPFESLYAVMTPEQQSNADRTFNQPGPRMGRPRR